LQSLTIPEKKKELIQGFQRPLKKNGNVKGRSFSWEIYYLNNWKKLRDFST